MKLNSLRYLTKEGFHSIIKNSLMSLASVAVFTSCLLIIGSALLIFANINAIVSGMMEQNVIAVFIQEGTSQEDMLAMKERIVQIDNVNSCEFVSSEEGFNDISGNLNQQDLELIRSYIGTEFLPDSYRLTLKDISLQSETVQQINTFSNVKSIRESDDLAQRLLTLRNSITYVSVGVILILFLVTVFIIANTVKITMFSRRLEINIMKAVGATKWFIRLPFLIEGIILGILAALLSLGLVHALYTLAVDQFAGALLALNSTFVPFNDLVVPLAGIFLFIGVFTGSFGSLISMGKYLKEHGSVVYNENATL
ncbi:MAG: permease-like cell division protein FtsX [Oscillospiraceae bacterium]|jgi:cell division transport system permease protein|nr:permease-like cell division protein FtsX [Oscillospiraceae bacterium]